MRSATCFVAIGESTSFVCSENHSMSIDARSHYAAAGFVVLLLLSVFWPAPVVSVNHLWLHRDLGIDELSFLGREAPSWDAVFWCIAGLFAIGVVQSGDGTVEDLRMTVRNVRVT